MQLMKEDIQLLDVVEAYMLAVVGLIKADKTLKGCGVWGMGESERRYVGP